MKILNKLQINSEKIIKNEELTALRGGYDDGNPDCSSTSKIVACEGLYDGHGCCWQYNGYTQYGKCRSYLGGELHCSDLN